MPVSLRGKTEVGGHQAEENYGKQRDRGHVQIKIHERMNENGHQPERSSQNEGRFIAPFRRQIVLRSLNVFPASEDLPEENPPDGADQKKADQSPVCEGVDVVVVRASGTVL